MNDFLNQATGLFSIGFWAFVGLACFYVGLDLVLNPVGSNVLFVVWGVIAGGILTLIGVILLGGSLHLFVGGSRSLIAHYAGGR